ncbi:Crp/Fnr family transcriptional regulator [Spirosoma sp. KNUC1025]|uniref:Crp/Fnr family transcriptional regulator n=1 Tax=Spirosoma sp. KNUC1025 TaxID=2894082 RepID=UPI00386C1C9C|nr:Crp/Fnr family transcriptional regulator [Spirosoma sp. KNUC1025]
METLQTYFEHIGFSGDDLDKVVRSFQRQTFEKNDLVVTEGRTSKYLGLVEQGIFQYFVVKEGVEITSYVSVPNTWLASVTSFVSEKPALENVRALTSGTVFMISKSSLRSLIDTLPAFKDFYIALLEQSICGIDESRHDLIVLTAEQRYAKLLQKEPHLLQQIPLQHLAFMLGITPRHLSRIRNSIR